MRYNFLILLALLLAGCGLSNAGTDCDSLRVNGDTTTFWLNDTFWSYYSPKVFKEIPPKHDTTREYVLRLDTLEVVRDSVWYQPLDGEHWAYIGYYKYFWRSVCDTVWADKVQVWLTPGEVKTLRSFLRARIDSVCGVRP